MPLGLALEVTCRLLADVYRPVLFSSARKISEPRTGCRVGNAVFYFPFHKAKSLGQYRAVRGISFKFLYLVWVWQLEQAGAQGRF